MSLKFTCVFFKFFLLSFECQYVEGLFLDYLFNDGFLVPHGVDDDGASFDVEYLQKFGDGGNFITFLVDFDFVRGSSRWFVTRHVPCG